MVHQCIELLIDFDKLVVQGFSYFIEVIIQYVNCLEYGFEPLVSVGK
jgi:hypothetical protein